MTRSELWIARNNIKDNYAYIRDIFKSFGFREKVDFILDYDNAIRFKRWKNGYEQIYRIIVNKELLCITIYIRTIKNNKTLKERFHMYKKHDGTALTFNGYDAWYDCVKWLSKAR